mgnify:CR=1 FL=1
MFVIKNNYLELRESVIFHYMCLARVELSPVLFNVFVGDLRGLISSTTPALLKVKCLLNISNQRKYCIGEKSLHNFVPCEVF